MEIHQRITYSSPIQNGLPELIEHGLEQRDHSITAHRSRLQAAGVDAYIQNFHNQAASMPETGIGADTYRENVANSLEQLGVGPDAIKQIREAETNSQLIEIIKLF